MKITSEAMARLRRHGEEGYPHEICGLLVGPKAGGKVTQARPARNIVTDTAPDGHGPHDRYVIDPHDQIRIERECDAAGLEVLGYYHSHPDHPAQASLTDAKAAWQGPVYVIVAVHGGSALDCNAFVAERDGGPFRSEPIEIE